jgi:transglutaminase-like putative cysteine protease
MGVGRLLVPSKTALLLRSVVLGALAAGGCASVYDGYGSDVLQPVAVSGLSAVDSAVPAVLLLDEEVVRFGEDDTGDVVVRLFTRQQTRIHGAAGQDYRGAGVTYSSTFSTIEAFGARITTPDGRSVSVDTNDIIDVPELGSDVLYADTRRRFLKVPTVPPGSVVERASIERMTSPELFGFGAVFGGVLETSRARFVVEAPSGWQIDIMNSRPDAPPPVLSETGGVQRWVWERQELPALRFDNTSPWIGEMAEYVTVRLKHAVKADGTEIDGPGDDVELSRISANMMTGRAKVTPAIEDIVHTVLGADWSGVPERERAAKLYAWTRDSIRYCAVEIGFGGWVPHASDEVEKVRYGDCKDKANLLKALLQAAGVSSRLVTIYSSVAPSPFRLPVIAANFNHAILLVDLPDGSVFVDPTTRTVAFDDLPPNDEDRRCLPIDERGAALMTTPSSSPERDYRTTRTTLVAKADGTVTGTVVATLAGHHADHLRDVLLDTPHANREAAIARAVGTDATLKDAAVEHEEPPVHVTPVEVKATSTMQRGGDARRLGTLLKAVEFVEAGVPRLDPERAAVPMALWAKERLVDEVEVQLPAGFAVEHLPDPVSATSRLMSYDVRWTAEGSVLKLHHMLTVHENRLSVDDVVRWREGIAGYLRALESRVVLKTVARNASTGSTTDTDGTSETNTDDKELQ